jgi:hypothetical protein
MVTKRVFWYKRFKFESCERGVLDTSDCKGSEGARGGQSHLKNVFDRRVLTARDCT